MVSVRCPGLWARRELDWAMAVFCLGTIVFLVYRDFALPHVRNTEVWFGFEVRGVMAMATAPLHWGIFAVGAWLFGKRSRHACLYASFYAVYIALSHLVWNLTSPNGGGIGDGLIQLGLFMIPAALLFWLYDKRRSLPGL